jgi:hypothetical protein
MYFVQVKKGQDGMYYYNVKTGETRSDLPQDSDGNETAGAIQDVVFRGVKKSAVGGKSSGSSKYDVDAKWSAKRSKKMQDGKQRSVLGFVAT